MLGSGTDEPPIASPVTKVNFSVENTRIGQRIDFDKLVLDIWTDGTITPEESLSRSAQLLVRQFGLLADLGRPPAHADRPALSAAPARRAPAAPATTVRCSIDLASAARRFREATSRETTPDSRRAGYFILAPASFS